MYNLFYPELTGSKTLTSRIVSGGMTASKSPIGSTNVLVGIEKKIPSERIFTIGTDAFHISTKLVVVLRRN